MRLKHVFIPVLDVCNLLPFTLKATDDQQPAKNELMEFVKKLENNYEETIYHIEKDIIKTENYEKFIFENGGFMEIMIEAPVVMTAHFSDMKKAKKYKNALIKTLKMIIPHNQLTTMFMNSIEIKHKSSDDLNIEKWTKIKQVEQPYKNGLLTFFRKHMPTK
ncbi:MAG: hypothetical protein ABIC04_00860 [Nanoarchaeota archaeon]